MILLKRLGVNLVTYGYGWGLLVPAPVPAPARREKGTLRWLDMHGPMRIKVRRRPLAEAGKQITNYEPEEEA